MNRGDILNGTYRIEKLLGRGGIGSVYLCTNIKIGNMWAIKCIPRDKLNDKAMQEIEIMKRLNHPSLPQIIDVFIWEEALCIVESNIEGTPLDRLLKLQGCFKLEKVVGWFFELCDILGYLHGMRPNPIIYRDMKPSNIMLAQGCRLVLVDFGISKEFSRHQRRDAFLAGTSAYAAPEQLLKGGITDQRTDIYSLGVTIYQLLYGRFPSGGSENIRITKDKAESKVNDIISKCMKDRPEDRYQRIEEIQRELRLVKGMIAAGRAHKALLFKLKLSLAAVLSIISYAAAVLGWLVS